VGPVWQRTFGDSGNACFPRAPNIALRRPQDDHLGPLMSIYNRSGAPLGPNNSSKSTLEGPRRPKIPSLGRVGLGLLGRGLVSTWADTPHGAQTASNRPELAPKSIEHDPTRDRICCDRFGSAPWRLRKRMLSESTNKRPETTPR
jgi:hypothetical protein